MVEQWNSKVVQCGGTVEKWNSNGGTVWGHSGTVGWNSVVEKWNSVVEQ